MNPFASRSMVRGLSIVALATVTLVAGAAPASADTAQASATAAELQLLAVPAVSSGQVLASNDGEQETIVGSTGPALSLLGTQSLIAAGALVQEARAFDNGVSAACAGLVGEGGSIEINSDGTCTTSDLPTGGVSLALGTAVLTADAILGQCAARSDGDAVGRATLVGAQLLGADGIPIPLHPDPDTAITVPGVASLELNAQASDAGSVTVAAISLELLSLLGPALATLDLGLVTCGPNVQVVGVSAAPPALLGAAVFAGVVGGGMYSLRRRRSSGSLVD